MTDTEKKYLNSSSKKKDYSTWIYLLVWLVLSSLLIAGAFFLFKWWDGGRRIRNIKESIHNTQDAKLPEKNEIKFDSVRNSIFWNHNRKKSIARKINKNLEKLGIWKEDLEKIEPRLTTWSQLKAVGRKNPEQLEKIYWKVFYEGVGIGRLEEAITEPGETEQQEQVQQKWLEEQVENEKLAAFQPIKELMDRTYKKFLAQLPIEAKKTPWNILPVQINGRPANPDDLEIEVKYLLEKHGDRIHPDWNHKWRGFEGFLTKKDLEESEKEGGHLMGLTTTGGGSSMGNVTKIVEGNPENFMMIDDDIFKCVQGRSSGIKLRKELLINRLNPSYVKWITREGIKVNFADISEDSLLNTIAHELAHAVINALRYEYELENGGHGDLHDDYTDQIEDLIKSDPLYEEDFMNWWREPQTENG